MRQWSDEPKGERKVDRILVFSALYQSGMLVRFVSLIQALHLHTRGPVRVYGEVTSPFETRLHLDAV